MQKGRVKLSQDVINVSRRKVNIRNKKIKHILDYIYKKKANNRHQQALKDCKPIVNNIS